MAKNKIEPEELTKTVMEYLENYGEDIEDEVVEVTDQVTKEAKEELVRTSPRGQGNRENPYYKGWTIKVSARGNTKYHKAIWNRTNYQLTHLLEFGHAKSNGSGRVAAQPHIRQVEEKYKVEFVDLLNKKIGGIK